MEPLEPLPPAHPRVCGENPLLFIDSFKHIGSSPRVRGKHIGPQQFDDMERLIPACAGKTYGCLTASLRLRAHPRVCGENVRYVRRSRMISGSSPRVRGKH